MRQRFAIEIADPSTSAELLYEAHEWLYDQPVNATTTGLLCDLVRHPNCPAVLLADALERRTWAASPEVSEQWAAMARAAEENPVLPLLRLAGEVMA